MKPDQRLEDVAVKALPHRHPFLLLDRTLMLEQGRWVVGIKNVSRADSLVDATGVLPAVCVAEVMAQAAGLAMARSLEDPHPAVLVRIDRFHCRPPICAGDQLLVMARVVRRFGATAVARASVRVAGRRRAAAELVLHFPHG